MVLPPAKRVGPSASSARFFTGQKITNDLQTGKTKSAVQDTLINSFGEEKIEEVRM
jgi:hypothetical protein